MIDQLTEYIDKIIYDQMRKNKPVYVLTIFPDDEENIEKLVIIGIYPTYEQALNIMIEHHVDLLEEDLKDKSYNVLQYLNLGMDIINFDDIINYDDSINQEDINIIVKSLKIYMLYKHKIYKMVEYGNGDPIMYEPFLNLHYEIKIFYPFQDLNDF